MRSFGCMAGVDRGVWSPINGRGGRRPHDNCKPRHGMRGNALVGQMVKGAVRHLRRRAEGSSDMPAGG